MRTSLRFTLGLCGLATVCGAASLIVLERQERSRTRTAAEQLAGGSVAAGQLGARRYGCGGCHRIKGVDGATGSIGPSLDGFAVRAQIAGRLTNQPDNLLRWIQHPQEIDPGNGMPDVGVTEGDARDIAAYLYTLRSEL